MEVNAIRFVVGSDEDDPLVEHVVEGLRSRRHEADVLPAAPWPSVARQVAEAVAGGEADQGVLFCWTGTGVSIAANKVDGVRAALCTDAETARGARRWNDANVLALGLRLTSPTVAREMVEAFLSTDPDPGEAETIARVG